MCIHRITLRGQRAMNNISSNLPTYNGLIPDSRSPASTRSHPFKFNVKAGQMTGSFALTVCKLTPGPTNDARLDSERDRIDIEFTATSMRRTPDETTFSGFRHSGWNRTLCEARRLGYDSRLLHVLRSQGLCGR
jgi:hypothetical protein